MTKKRIQELADFFYSSNSSNVVPFRIAIVMGMAGTDLNKYELIGLLSILNNSKNLKKDLLEFREWVNHE